MFFGKTTTFVSARVDESLFTLNHLAVHCLLLVWKRVAVLAANNLLNGRRRFLAVVIDKRKLHTVRTGLLNTVEVSFGCEATVVVIEKPTVSDFDKRESRDLRTKTVN